MRFIDLFAKIIDYHAKTKRLPGCEELGRELDRMFDQWVAEHPEDQTVTDPATAPIRQKGRRAS